MRQEHPIIETIILKHLREEPLNEAEKNSLNDWIHRSDNNKNIFNRLCNEDTMIHDLLQLDREGNTAAWEKLYAQIHNGINPLKHSANRSWQRYTVAASVLLALTAGSYFWFAGKRDNNNKATTKQSLVNDIAPGGDKAILILEDGTQVILDSQQNGQLVQQGGSMVTKHNGQLQYETARNYPNQQAITYNTLSTPKGGQYQLLLPDGSKVWLNAASSIRYPTAFSGNERRVEIITGEAYFEVKKSPKQPFRVAINPPPGGRGAGGEVEVLGTHFNINSYGDDGKQRVTLLEGSVKVTPRSGGEGAGVRLKPGEQAQLTIDPVRPGHTGGHSQLTIHNNADTEQAVAWVNGYFKFNDTDLKTIMRYIERWYAVQVIYKGEVPDIHITGKAPRNLSLVNLIKVMQLSKVKCYIEGDQLIIEP